MLLLEFGSQLVGQGLSMSPHILIRALRKLKNNYIYAIYTRIMSSHCALRYCSTVMSLSLTGCLAATTGKVRNVGEGL